jgi:predicted dehydrogenase
MSLKTGILSTAHLHAGGYARALATNPRSQLLGIADEEPERGRAMAERFGVAFYDSYERLVEEADAVAIASENVKHRQFVELAASHGCHMICEKPLCTTIEDGRAMLEACEKAGVQLMTCFPCRYAPSYRRLVERVRAGEVGEVLAVCATNHGQMPQNSWFNVVSLSGGGAMMDHTVHVADLLRALLGSEAVEVYAETGNNMYHGSYEDIAMLTVTFENGVFATIDASWSRPLSFRTWGDVTMNVVGTGGVAEIDLFSQAVLSYSNKDMRVREAGYGTDLDRELMSDFLAAAEEGTPVPISGYDGFKAAEMAIAGYESARTGRPVRLPL